MHTRCKYCLRVVDTAQASAVAAHDARVFIKDLASFRGISFEEAEKQVQEDQLVESMEAKWSGRTALDQASPASPFYDKE